MRYAEVDMSIAADAEATLPALIEEIRRLTTGSRRAFRQRGEQARRSEPRDVGAGAHRGDLRLGREPGQHGAAVDGAVGADQERGLVAT